MPQIVPIYFAPDLDNAWSVAPGALTFTQNYAPLQLGAYGSIGSGAYLSGLTGSDIVSAYMFRKIAGTVRFLVNRATNLDEYDNAAVRTNRATGLTSTLDWSMCAQGDAIVACSIDNATQVSTGAGFAALGGGSPKAKHCASNFGFVMLANTDTSADQIAWSALYNYTSFVPSIATEAGNTRLLEAPGPITALIAFRKGFVAFKDNSIFVGTYSGPNYIWSWVCLSQKIGCVGSKAVAELDGKLYFMHTTGFYEFDGQTLVNIGLPVNHTFLASVGYITNAQLPVGATGTALSGMQLAVDDIEGVVWFRQSILSAGKVAFVCYGYNPRSQKWSSGPAGGGYDFAAVMVQAASADVQTFKADTTARFLVIQSLAAAVTVQRYAYPSATTSANGPAYFITGVIGSLDGASNLLQIHWRTLYGSSIDNTPTISVFGFTAENQNIANGGANGVVNTEFDYADVLLASRFRIINMTQTQGKVTILAGLGIVAPSAGKR